VVKKSRYPNGTLHAFINIIHISNTLFIYTAKEKEREKETPYKLIDDQSYLFPHQYKPELLCDICRNLRSCAPVT
jgi:hypothetical protein